MPTRVKDIALKAFWTLVAVGLPAAIDSLQESDLPAGWYAVYTALATVVLAGVRQLAGGYAPPPAADAKAQLPETRV